MSNQYIHGYYEEMAKNIKSPLETRNKAKDFTRFDVALMKNFANKNRDLLDLGSGTGLLINPLNNDFRTIVAVEKYKAFSDFIIRTPTIEVINSDILDLENNRSFDVVSIFGVMNFFNSTEANLIYKKVAGYLRKNNESVAIVKHQMGLEETFTVNGWSEELNKDYYAEYRHVDIEIAMLSQAGFSRIEKVDVYPKEYNRWENTHFYALVCYF